MVKKSSGSAKSRPRYCISRFCFLLSTLGVPRNAIRFFLFRCFFLLDFFWVPQNRLRVFFNRVYLFFSSYRRPLPVNVGCSPTASDHSSVSTDQSTKKKYYNDEKNKRHFEMTFCCTEKKAFKLLAQKVTPNLRQKVMAKLKTPPELHPDSIRTPPGLRQDSIQRSCKKSRFCRF